LWVGLLAATLCMPVVMSTLTAFSIYSLMIPPELVLIVGLGISGLVTFAFALPLVLWLRRRGRLSAIVLCASGSVAGGLAMGLFTLNHSYYPQIADRAFALQIAKDAALNSIPLGAAYGFVSAVALCVGAGITIRSSGRLRRPLS
jgi:hypothetical protein